MKQVFPRYLPPNVPVYYDPVSQSYAYLYENGRMSIEGNNLSMSSPIELEDVVLALTQDIVMLTERIAELEKSAPPTNKKESK